MDHNIDPDEHYFYFNEGHCNNYDLDSFKSDVCVDEESISLFHLNLRSAGCHLDETLLMLDSLSAKFSVIVFTETWLNDEADSIDIPGYTSYHSVRRNKNGGGVTILVDCNLKCELYVPLTVNDQCFESCAVSIQCNGTILNVLGVYRPPSTHVNNNITRFCERFFHSLESSDFNKGKTVIVGDFNIDISPTVQNNDQMTFINEFKSFHFFPIINLPTRETEFASTCIDHIWTNCLLPYKAGVLKVEISDHYPIFVLFPNIVAKIKYNRFMFRHHCDNDVQLFKDDVRRFVGDFQVLAGVEFDDRCKLFCVGLFDLYDVRFPIKYKQISEKRLNAPWLTRALLASIKRKHYLCKQFKL